MNHAARFAAACFALALAGCFGDLASDDSPAAQTSFAFTAPLLVGGGATGETFLAVGADGAMLACSHGMFTGPGPLWVSHDEGDHWVETIPEPNPLPDGDCDVDISPTGAWAILYDWVGGASIAVSRDQGRSWTMNHAIAPPVTGVVDRPWFAFHGERILLSYKGIGQGPGIVVVRTSDDDGATWSTPQPVSVLSDPRLANHIGFDFLVGADGTVRIPLVKYDNDPSVDETFSFLVSRDRGDSWQEQPALGPLDADVLVGSAVAGDGTTLYWAWHDDAGKLLESHSLDDGATWSEPFLIAEGEFVYTPAIDGRADGTATVAWIQSGPFQAAAARLDGRLAQPVVAIAILEGPSDTPQSAEFSALRHDAQGYANVVYAWDPGNDSCQDLRHAANGICVHFVRELA
ncbi:MAG: sialidase family protein [Candidatus Thermoplasmatota archaeon]